MSCALCDEKDIAGFLEEHDTEVTEDDRKAIDEAVSIARSSRYAFGTRITSLRQSANLSLLLFPTSFSDLSI